MYDTIATMSIAMTTGHVAFERRGKVRLWSILYLICVTKHINSVVSQFLRVIHKVNNTTEVLFIFWNI